MVETLVPHNEIFQRSKHIASIGHQDVHSQMPRQAKPVSKRFSTHNNDPYVTSANNRIHNGQTKPNKPYLTNEKLDPLHTTTVPFKDAGKCTEPQRGKRKEEGLAKQSPDRPQSKVEMRSGLQTTPKVPIQISERGSTLIDIPLDMNSKLRSPQPRINLPSANNIPKI